ncbi:MAG: phosphoenolpyruvate carboxylase [Candidatus Saccharimonadales bacterium]|nr:phosphoenolpyruvate carboxylase [Candidatus Saccharimonadales bacterium]
MRRIPSLMASQHPDNAAAPYWKSNGDPFINTLDELEDAIHSLKELNATEYMWDWEGKFADASIIDRLYTKYIDFFQEQHIGKDKFITFRLPNIWEEKGYNLLQAMNAILIAEDQAKDLGFEHRPLFEVILPMTESADQLMKMHDLFTKLAVFKNKQFNPEREDNITTIELIPLIESVAGQLKISELLEDYIDQLKSKTKSKPTYIRPFIACSDPAIVSGWLPTKLANREAVSQSYSFAAKQKIEIFPIVGVGSLPFRGGLSPSTIDSYIANNPGVRTVTIQSSFRFDNPPKIVARSSEELTRRLRTSKPSILSAEQSKDIKEIIELSQSLYQATLNDLINDMQPIFAAVPKRRERRQHIGLLAYSRKSGKTTMPRAITFTASFYSIGVPPEFIGLGRALSSLSGSQIETLNKVLPALDHEIVRAGKFINKENLRILAQRNRAWGAILKDIELTEDYIGQSFAPVSNKEKSHRNLAANCLIMKNNPPALSQLITDTALLRGSLG